MNLSTVRNIYTPIGKNKFDSLVRNEVTSPYKKQTKLVSRETLDSIANIIKEKCQVSRLYLLEISGQSKTTTEIAIRVMFESGLIRKDRNRALNNHPTTYVWIGE